MLSFDNEVLPEIFPLLSAAKQAVDEKALGEPYRSTTIYPSGFIPSGSDRGDRKTRSDKPDPGDGKSQTEKLEQMSFSE